jgi:hypothetical protein
MLDNSSGSGDFSESGELVEIADSPVLAGFNIPGTDATLKFKQTNHVRHQAPIYLQFKGLSHLMETY